MKRTSNAFEARKPGIPFKGAVFVYRTYVRTHPSLVRELEPGVAFNEACREMGTYLDKSYVEVGTTCLLHLRASAKERYGTSWQHAAKKIARYEPKLASWALARAAEEALSTLLMSQEAKRYTPRQRAFLELIVKYYAIPARGDFVGISWSRGKLETWYSGDLVAWFEFARAIYLWSTPSVEVRLKMDWNVFEPQAFYDALAGYPVAAPAETEEEQAELQPAKYELAGTTTGRLSSDVNWSNTSPVGPDFSVQSNVLMITQVDDDERVQVLLAPTYRDVDTDKAVVGVIYATGERLYAENGRLYRLAPKTREVLVRGARADMIVIDEASQLRSQYVVDIAVRSKPQQFTYDPTELKVVGIDVETTGQPPTPVYERRLTDFALRAVAEPYLRTPNTPYNRLELEGALNRALQAAGDPRRARVTADGRDGVAVDFSDGVRTEVAAYEARREKPVWYAAPREYEQAFGRLFREASGDSGELMEVEEVPALVDKVLPPPVYVTSTPKGPEVVTGRARFKALREYAEKVRQTATKLKEEYSPAGKSEIRWDEIREGALKKLGLISRAQAQGAYQGQQLSGLKQEEEARWQDGEETRRLKEETFTPEGFRKAFEAMPKRSWPEYAAKYLPSDVERARSEAKTYQMRSSLEAFLDAPENEDK